MSHRLGYKMPEFENLNQIIATVMAGVSTSLRFPGQLNGCESFVLFEPSD